MPDLTDLQERVLSVLEQRSQLDLEQVAAAARLTTTASHQALQGLERIGLVTIAEGRYGDLYEVDRHNAQERIEVA